MVSDGVMRRLAGRGKKRIAKGEVVVLARPNSLGFEHPATTENMSEQGLCLIAEPGWKPRDRVPPQRPGAASQPGSFTASDWARSPLLWV